MSMGGRLLVAVALPGRAFENSPEPTPKATPKPMTRNAPAGLAAALFLAACASVPPPTAELAAAERGIREAEARQPRGAAQQALTEARLRLATAREASARGRQAEALVAAREAEAAAAHAAAEARRAALEEEVESKAVRNAELRRRLLVQGG